MQEDKLTEKQALARAKEEGIEFVDFYTFDGATVEYLTEKEAEKDANGAPILQARRQKIKGE